MTDTLADAAPRTTRELAERTYRDAVIELAKRGVKDRMPSVETLVLAGKSVADFDRDFEILRQRFEARRILDDESGEAGRLLAEADRIKAEWKALDDEIGRLKAEYREKADPILRKMATMRIDTEPERLRTIAHGIKLGARETLRFTALPELEEMARGRKPSDGKGEPERRQLDPLIGYGW